MTLGIVKERLRELLGKVDLVVGLFYLSCQILLLVLEAVLFLDHHLFPSIHLSASSSRFVLNSWLMTSCVLPSDVVLSKLTT
ncbi:hypothetical protein [Rhizobium rhizogenes]